MATQWRNRKNKKNVCRKDMPGGQPKKAAKGRELGKSRRGDLLEGGGGPGDGQKDTQPRGKTQVPN